MFERKRLTYSRTRAARAAVAPLAAVLALAAPAVAQISNQDDCANSGLDSVGVGKFAWDNTAATAGIEGQNEALCYVLGTSAIDADVWFTFEADVTGMATIDTCGAPCDTRIAAYPDLTPCPIDGSAVACNDDACSLQSSITFPVTCGQSFVIQLGSFPGGLQCAGQVTITETGVSCNDHAVENTVSGARFMTIQAAIDDQETLAGQTLRMLVPVHSEGPQVHFTKSVALRGAAGGTTLLQTGDTGSSGDPRGWFLTDAGTVVDLENLHFDGEGFLVWQAIRAKGEGSLTDCSFEDIQYNASGPHYSGVAIATIDANWTIRDCAFSAIGRIGMHIFGAGVTDCRIENVTYTGKGVGDFLDYGVEVGGGAIAYVENAMITACRGVASVDGSASAALLATTFFGAGTTATVTRSTLTDSIVGLVVGVDGTDQSDVEATFNNITGNDYGLSNASFQSSVDARWNWWGHPTGPSDLGGTFEAGSPPCFPPDSDPQFDVVNADGLGNAVDPNVSYCPWRTSLAGPGLGLSYCRNTPNSTGASAEILASGSASVALNRLTLIATQLPPNRFGFFLASNAPGFTNLPAVGLSDGFFCLGVTPMLGRYDGQVRFSGPLGFFQLRLDLTAIPIAVAPGTTALAPGDTWYFQAWFRDSPPSDRNNFTDAVAIEFE